MRGGGLVLLGALFLGVTASARSEAGAVADSAGAPSALSETRVETILVGLSVQGEKLLDRIAVLDLDAVETETGEKLLPVLRLLQILGIQAEHQGSEFVFYAPTKEQVRLDTAAGKIQFAEQPLPATVRMGISDLTGDPEFFVEATTAARLLGLDLQWNENLYAYEATPLAPLPVFQRQGMPTRRQVLDLENLGFDLPELYPAARPGHGVLSLAFLSLRLRGSAAFVQAQGGGFDTSPYGTVGVSGWGSLLGGDYEVSLVQTAGAQINLEPPTLEQATWTLRGRSGEVTIGDRSFGLSQLVFPAVTATGVVMNALTRVSDLQTRGDLSGLGSQPSFEPTLHVSGEAPVGSRVQLRINQQLLDEVIIKEANGDTPGQGTYRFEGTNVLTGRANHMLIVITHPDGSQEEIDRQIVGSSDLLQPGQLAVVGGAGVKRNPSASKSLADVYGRFLGFRGLVGVTSNITAGGSVGWQDEFASLVYADKNFDPSQYPLTLLPPRRSLHSGGQLTWRVFNPILLSLEGGWVRTPDDSTDVAWIGSTSIQFGEASFGLYGFSYGTNYFNGTNERVADRRGGALDTQFQITSRTRLGITAVRAEDNVDRSRSVTRVENLHEVEIISGQLVPRASTTLRGSALSSPGQEISYLAGTDISGSLTRRLSYRLTVMLGDDLRASQDLFDGLSIPGVFTSDTPRRYLEVSYGLGRMGSIRASHNRVGGLDRTLVGHVLPVSGTGRPWAWSLEGGYDWASKDPLVNCRLDYFLDREKIGRLGLDARLTGGGTWSLGVSLEHTGLLALAGGGPRFKLGSRLNPERGGVKGKVFFDIDADGVLDPGEPGLGGILVLSQLGDQAVSGKGGEYLIGNTGSQRIVRVSLDAKSIPASYTPTNGTQLANIRNGVFTEVNLGLASLAAVSGRLRARLPDGSQVPVGGVKIVLLDAKGAVVNHSITAGDGTYYIGELKSGAYTLQIAADTIPAKYRFETLSRPVQVIADSEFKEVEGLDFEGTLIPQ